MGRTVFVAVVFIAAGAWLGYEVYSYINGPAQGTVP